MIDRAIVSRAILTLEVMASLAPGADTLRFERPPEADSDPDAYDLAIRAWEVVSTEVVRQRSRLYEAAMRGERVEIEPRNIYAEAATAAGNLRAGKIPEKR